MSLGAIVVPSAIEPGYFWLASMLVGLACSVGSASRLGLDPRPMYWTGVAAVAVGIWGSHLLGVLVNGTEGDLIWLRVWEGGKSWYGGLFGGALGALVGFRIARCPVLRYADAMVPAVVLGYAIGRIGCFFNGDDYGMPSSLPWAVQYGPDTEAFYDQAHTHLIDASARLTVPVHPTQLYHSLLGVFLFVGLSRVSTEPPGRRLALLALTYGTARFVLEWLRGEFSPLASGLSVQQWISLLLIMIGAALLVRQVHRAPSPRVIMTEAAAAEP
jgi:phosphatidylglycerol:prolipoprotein diacylglycerol transferase